MPRNAFTSLLIASLLLLSQVSAYAGHQCPAASEPDQHASMAMSGSMAMPTQPMMAGMHHQVPDSKITDSKHQHQNQNQQCDGCNCASPCAASTSVGVNSNWTLGELPSTTTTLISRVTNTLLDNDPSPPFRPPSHA